MPSMCIVSGHCYAGGLIFALCHDFRIMTTNTKPKVCLSEINIGMALPPSYAVAVKYTLTPSTARYLSLGPAVTSKEAFDLGVFTGLFKDYEDAQKQITTFDKMFSN